MNRTATILPVIGALVKTEDILGPNRTWVSENEQQRRLLAGYFAKREELSHLSSTELRSWVDTVASNLNEILQREGFSIHLDDFGADEFGSVSILDVMVEWLLEGETTTILARGQQYPGVRLANDGQTLFYARHSSVHEHPVAAVRTKSGDTLYMTVAGTPLADFDLLDRINAIESHSSMGDMYAGLTFPMIDLDETVDVGWLPGLHTSSSEGVRWFVRKALQQTKFKMNHKGARVKSAVALTMERFATDTATLELLIDQPFFLWIKRPGMEIPIFAAYLDETVWKDPGALEF